MMSTRNRFRMAASALALAGVLSACAAGGNRVTKASDFRAKGVKVGLATRALAALNANDSATAVQYAEQAVAQTPRDAGFRALLGKAYFAAGRFASAEQAFKDALSLYPDQPQIMLKLALVQIAQGKNADALEFLEFARPALDSADYGLAIALAGKPQNAIDSLRSAASQRGADARVRQNLALAYALAGDWVNARVVAAADVSPDKLDARIQEWMQFAGGATKPATQIAALTGVTPAPFDPGAPVALALVKPEAATAVAAAQPAPVPAPLAEVPAPQPEVSYAPPPPPPVAPAVVATVSTPAEVASQVGSITVNLPAPRPADPAPAIAAAAPQEFPFVEVKKRQPKAKVVKASAPAARAAFQRAVARPAGKARVVVQLGAYGSSERVLGAWNAAARKYRALANYAPMSARFAGPKGIVYRLSVRGFADTAEAGRVCASVKRAGGSCFVRTIAGDRPMQLASR
jgi:Flp pilus assembly protein TadD